EIPRIRRTLVSRPAVFITLDGRELNGTKTYFGIDPSKPSITDGQISEVEENLMQKEITPDSNWIMMSTGDNLDGLAVLNYSHFDDYPVTPFIQDDFEAENKPEFHKGQSPNLGFQLQGVPMKGVQ